MSLENIFAFLHIYHTFHWIYLSCLSVNIYICLYISIWLMFKFFTMNNEFFLKWHLKFPGRRWGPITTTPPGWYDVMILIALLQDLLLVPAAQDSSNLVSWNGAHLIQHFGQTCTKYSETIGNFKRHWSWNLTIILLSQDPPERTSPPWQLEVILEDDVPSPSKVCPWV